MTVKFIKDPQAVLDYYWDWKALTNNNGPSDWLEAGETISTYTVTPDTGLTKDSATLINTNTTVKAWFSGGTAGQSYKVTCHIVTSASRTDDRTIIIAVDNR